MLTSGDATHLDELLTSGGAFRLTDRLDILHGWTRYVLIGFSEVCDINTA